MDGMPDEPLSPTAEGLAAAHEMFLSLIEGGFTEQQALFIVAQVLMGRP